MERKNKTLIKAGVVSFIAVVSLVVTSASPAAALVVVGEGAGVAFDYPTNNPSPPGPCLTNPTAVPIGGNRFVVTDNPATYTGVAEDPAVPVFVGTVEIDVQIGPHFISPVGTHLGCPGVLPTPIPITTATVSGTGPDLDPDEPPGTGNVTCNNGQGFWLRTGTHVTIDFVSDCTVDGNVVGGTATAPTRHILQYDGAPCTIPPTDIENPACDVIGTVVPPDDPPGPGAAYVGEFTAESVA